MRDFSFRAYHPGERKMVYFDFNDLGCAALARKRGDKTVWDDEEGEKKDGG